MTRPIAIGMANQAVRDVVAEINRAMGLAPPMNSLHESYAVILEELDEAWGEIKVRKPDPQKVRGELVQVAAMAIRAIVDCLDNAPDPDVEARRQERQADLRWQQQRAAGS